MGLTYFQNDSIDQQVVRKLVSHIVTSGEDSANAATITIAGIGTVDQVVFAQIESTGNVKRAPQGAVTKSGTTVTVNDSGLAVSEVITLEVIAYNA